MITEPSPCPSFIPPYLVDRLADSGDAAVAERARHTRRLDARLRRERLSARGGGGRTAGAAGRGGLTRSLHDADNGEELPGALVRAEGDPPSGDEAINQAYDGLGETYALWQQAYGRDSLDGKGLPLVATVHYGVAYDNAFWDDTQMVFGDGDGTIFLSFTRSLEVIGHELAHGVTQYTSGLNYSHQSGALNEHVSDVFGVLVKQRMLGQSADAADWLIGADLLAPGVQGKALRSMAEPGTAYDDPRLGKDPQPGHFRDFVETQEDYGGVHINSGIPNRAFYLVATALGGNAWEDAGQIWYDTIVGDIAADCDFETFARLTTAAATARFGAGSTQESAVVQAWQQVGVTEAALDVAGSPTETEAAADQAPADQAPAAATADVPLTVRRTGGVAGIVREKRVRLDELPVEDAEHWQRLLRDGSLHGLAVDGGHPDGFCYAVECPEPQTDLTIPEPALPRPTRELFIRTLGLR